MEYRSILELTAEEARAFFLRGSSYFTLDMPKYFDFAPAIEKAETILSTSKVPDLWLHSPDMFDDVNYSIVCNKDGEFAWRKHQIIHPLLYANLVNIITDEIHWRQILDRFNSFSAKRIECVSIPVVAEQDGLGNAAMVSNWSDNFSNKILDYSRSYSYMMTTDITDCYGSLYTHSIAWAIHGIEEAKKQKNNKELLGNKIDAAIRLMSYGQTNGIPQGSVIMDFIAEIVLGYIDLMLQTDSDELGLENFQIIRYRDDYRIFANDLTVAKTAMKILSETLMKFGLRINPVKTRTSSDIVLDALKPDKLEWLKLESVVLSEDTSLLNGVKIIKDFSVNHPNSGLLKTALEKLYEQKLVEIEILPNGAEQIVDITVDIMYRNPISYPYCVAILGKIMDLQEDGDREKLVDDIRTKFDNVPNTEYLDIWLQRLTAKVDTSIRYNSKISQLLCEDGSNIEIWNSDWLPNQHRIDNQLIISKQELDGMAHFMSIDEIKLFKNRPESS